MSNNQLTVGELVYKISGDMENLKTELKKSEAEVLKLKDSMEKGTKTSNTFATSMKNLAKGLGLIYLTKLMFDFGKTSIQAFANAQNSLIQFNNAQQNVAGSTKEQIDDMNEFVLALEKKTSVDDKTIRQGAQILAQDQIKIENQKQLLAGIVDIAVANSKSNGGEVDVQGTATAIGRAMATGELGTLTRQNIVGIDASTASLFKLGTQAERTAILTKILAENGKGAGEALGASFQGKINKARDTVEDLQVAIGKGLTASLIVLGNSLTDTVGSFELTGEGTERLGTAFTYVAGLVGFTINVFKLLGLTVYRAGFDLVNFAKITYSFGKDVVGVFKQVGTAIVSIGTGLKKVLTGDFSEAIDAVKDGFDFSGTFDNAKKALDEAKESTKQFDGTLEKVSLSIADNVDTMARANEVYKEASAQQDALTEAKTSAKDAQEKETALTEAQTEALKKLEEQSNTYKEKFVGIIQSIKEAIKGLNDDISKAFKKFNDELKTDFKDGNDELVNIYLDAKDRIEEIQNQISDIDGTDAGANKQRNALEKELREQEEILSSRRGFEKRQADTIAEIKKKLTDAGIDAEKEGLDALTNITSLKQRIKEEEALRDMDEFERAEELNKRKLFALTDQLIAEVTAMKEKVSQQEALEADLTTFLMEQNQIRTADVDAFASNAIAKYGEIASALRTAISLQNQLNALKNGGSSKQQFAIGGYVGASGGEVHPGEYVIPANMVQAMGGFVSQLESARISGGNTSTVNAPITVNANVRDDLDFRALSKELAWELNRR